MNIVRLVSSTVLAVACTAPAWSAGAGPTPAATAAQLLDLAASSYAERDLALASLRFAQAQRLAPAVANASDIAKTLEQARVREEQCMSEGLDAGRARDLKGVRQSVKCLRELDAHSSAALEVVLRYQAMLADLGGAFPRVRWTEWRDAATADAPFSPRQTAAASPGTSK